MEDALRLHENDYAFLDKQDQLNVPVDVKQAYEKLRSFFQWEMKMTYREADEEAAEIWEGIQDNVDFLDIFHCLMDAYGENLSNRKLEKLLQLLQDANNHTRLQIHRGHTPVEMMKLTEGLSECPMSLRFRQEV